MAGLLDDIGGSGTLSRRASLLDRLSSGEQVAPEERVKLDMDSMNSLNEFQKGLRRSAYSAGATSQAMLGQALEPFAPGLAAQQFAEANKTLRTMPQNIAPRFNTFDEARKAGFRGLVDYGAGALGEAATSAATMGAGALLGGGVGALAGNAARGALLGGAAAMVPQEGGETALQLQNDSVAMANTTPAQRLALSTGRGGINALAETLVPAAMVAPRVLGQLARTAPGLGNAIRNTGIAAAGAGLGEYGTEYGQELTGQLAQNLATGRSDYDLAAANEAGIRGAIGGVGLGAIGGGVQSVRDNLAPAADAAAARMPTLDGVLSGMFNAADNPREFGSRVAGMTMDQVGQLLEKSGELGKYASSGVKTGADVVGNLKKQFDRYIIKNVSPENQKRYMEFAADLNSKTKDQVDMFRRTLEAETGQQFLDGIGVQGRVLFDKGVANAKKAGSWLSDFAGGMYDTFAQNNKAEGKKQSLAIKNDWSSQERTDVLRQLTTASPQLEQLIKKGSINDRRQLADIILSARENSGWLQGADFDPRRQQILEGWQANTGTDLRKVLNSIEPSPKSELRWAQEQQIAGNQSDWNSIDKNNIYDIKREGPIASEDDEGGSSRLIEAQGVRDLREVSEQDDQSPFNEKSLPYSLVSEDHRYMKKRGADGKRLEWANSGLDINFKVDPSSLPEGVQLTNTQLANALGGRRYTKVPRFEQFQAGEIDDAADGLKMRINPMSLGKMVRDEAFRDQFEPHVGKWNEYPTLNRNEKAAATIIQALATLKDRGVHLNPEALGLPPGPPIKLDTDFDLNNLPDDTVLNRVGKTTYTLKDWRKDAAKVTSRDIQNRYEALKDPNNPEAPFNGAMDRLLQAVETSPAAGKLLERVTRTAKGMFKTRDPSDTQIEQALAEMGDRLSKSADRQESYDELNALRDAYRSGDLDSEQINSLAAYYDGTADDAQLDQSIETLDMIGREALPENGDRQAHADRLRDMAEAVASGNERFMDFLTMKLDPEQVDNADMQLSSFTNDVPQSSQTYRNATLNMAPAKQIAAIKRDRMFKKLSPEEKRVYDIYTRAANAIRAAKTTKELNDLGGKIARFKGELSDARLSELRDQWSDRKRSIIDAQRPSPPPGRRPPSTKRDPIATEISNVFSTRPVTDDMGNVVQAPANTPVYTPETAGARSFETAQSQREQITAYKGVDDYGSIVKRSVDNGTAAQAQTAQPTPPEVRAKFMEKLQKLVGNRVRVVFDDADLIGGVAGEYQSHKDKLTEIRNKIRQLKRDGNVNAVPEIEQLQAQEQKILNDTGVLGVLRLAMGRADQGGLAEHEGFHGAFSFFFTNEEKRVLTTAFSKGLVAKRLQEVFKDQPQVLAAMKEDPEEAAAYGFQVWMSNPELLKVGEQTNNLFEKFKGFVRKVLGILTNEEKAVLIMEDLASGRRAQAEVSPIAKVLDKDKAVTERAQEFAKEIGGVVKGFYDYLLTSVYTRLEDTNNPMLTKIARAGYQPTGEEGGGGMVQKMIHQNRLNQNRLDGIFRGLNEGQRTALQDAKIAATRPTDPELAKRYDQLTSFYKDMYKYQTSAGVALKDAGLEEDYYPLTWDSEKVLNNKEAFIEMLKKYEPQMNNLMKTPNEIWESITGDFERGENFVDVMGQDNEPVAASANKRTLGFISKEDRRPFMTDDPILTAMRYTKQAIRQAEFVRAYGVNGSKLKAWRDEARDNYGATPDQLKLASDYIDGLLGNKEAGMSRELKDLYGATTVYQNIRLLPFSVFNSLVDPLGIAVRSNSIGDAWKTFTYSMKNMFRDWKSEYTPDQWEMMAADMGIIERAGTTINTDNLYTGVTLRGTTKKINDAFFKYNLLNGWIRNNTIMAARSAQLFMLRAAQGKFKEEQNARYLEELGVRPDDIIESPDGEGIVWREEDFKAAGKSEDEAKASATRVRDATEMFVRQAMLNPNAAELPNWASNPYLLPIAHLKQFVWAFDSTIIDRIKHEAQYENYQPLLAAGMYVPGMIAATFLKDMVSNMGDEPPYKKEWGVVDYVMDGVNRSGLTGTGQFFFDAKEDIVRGGGGWESLAGPTVNQLKQAVQAAHSGNTDAMYRWTVKALPANPVYDQWLLD